MSAGTSQMMASEEIDARVRFTVRNPHHPIANPTIIGGIASTARQSAGDGWAAPAVARTKPASQGPAATAAAAIATVRGAGLPRAIPSITGIPSRIATIAMFTTTGAYAPGWEVEKPEKSLTTSSRTSQAICTASAPNSTNSARISRPDRRTTAALTPARAAANTIVANICATTKWPMMKSDLDGSSGQIWGEGRLALWSTSHANPPVASQGAKAISADSAPNPIARAGWTRRTLRREGVGASVVAVMDSKLHACMLPRAERYPCRADELARRPRCWETNTEERPGSVEQSGG